MPKNSHNKGLHQYPLMWFFLCDDSRRSKSKAETKSAQMRSEEVQREGTQIILSPQSETESLEEIKPNRSLDRYNVTQYRKLLLSGKNFSRQKNKAETLL